MRPHHNSVTWWIRHLWHHFDHSRDTTTAPSHSVLAAGICSVLLSASSIVVWAATRNPFGPPFITIAALGATLLLSVGVTMHSREPECMIGSGRQA